MLAGHAMAKSERSPIRLVADAAPDGSLAGKVSLAVLTVPLPCSGEYAVVDSISGGHRCQSLSSRSASLASWHSARTTAAGFGWHVAKRTGINHDASPQLRDSARGSRPGPGIRLRASISFREIRTYPGERWGLGRWTMRDAAYSSSRARPLLSDAREALLGPSYFYHRHMIELSRTWTASQIKDYQAARVSRVLKRYGTELTQKNDYQEFLRRYTRWNIAPLTRTVRTGGTSGQPLRFKADTFARRQKERAYLFDIWSQVGYRPHDLRVVYRGNVRRELLHFDRLENAWIVSPSVTDDEQIETLKRWLLRLPPFFLHVYPSSLHTFIDLVTERVFRQLEIRGILAGSENLAAGERLRFESEFGIRISHWYGHSEYAVLAFGCRECNGFHFYPTYGYVEFVPTELDRIQRIIATSFNRIGTQFCRYDTGDLAVPAISAGCVDHFPRVSAIAGRFQETFADEAGRRRALGPFLFGIHGLFWDDVRDLQFVQDRAGHLQVRLVTTPKANRRRLECALEERLTMVKLDYEYVAEIERTANGKRRYFVDASRTELMVQPAPADIPRRT